MKKAILSVALFILVVTMAGSGFWMARYFIDSREQKEAFSELAKDAATVTPERPHKSPVVELFEDWWGKDTGKDDKSQNEAVLHDLSELRSRNPDCIGWITVPGTGVDYPVMQTVNDPEYYLRHNFNKEASDYGVPFLDHRCSLDGGNLILYGHNKWDGSMFTPLIYFPDPEVREGKTMRLELGNEVREYAVVTAFSVDAAVSAVYDYPCLTTTADREAFLRTVQDESGVELTGCDFITLSTCDVSRSNGRIVVIGERRYKE